MATEGDDKYGAKEYDKIIRDKIPERITSAGRGLRCEVVDDEEARGYLIIKVGEEMKEYNEDDDQDPSSYSTMELIDVYEIIRRLAVIDGKASESNVDDWFKRNAQSKRDSHGGFSQNIILKETS